MEKLNLQWPKVLPSLGLSFTICKMRPGPIYMRFPWGSSKTVLEDFSTTHSCLAAEGDQPWSTKSWVAISGVLITAGTSDWHKPAQHGSIYVKFLEEAKLIYGEKSQDNACLWRGWQQGLIRKGHEGTVWGDGHV